MIDEIKPKGNEKVVIIPGASMIGLIARIAYAEFLTETGAIHPETKESKFASIVKSISDVVLKQTNIEIIKGVSDWSAFNPRTETGGTDRGYSVTLPNHYTAMMLCKPHAVKATIVKRPLFSTKIASTVNTYQ